MSIKTKIEWTDTTWNPIRGCSRVSEGCRNCYAEVIARRFKKPGLPYEGLIAKTGQWNGSIKVVDSLMTEPFKWKKPRRVFVNSMSDLFHENVPEETINTIFAVMALNPQHTFQILTKRPERMLQYCSSLGRHHSVDRVSIVAKKLDKDLNLGGKGFCWNMNNGGWALPNVLLGVSAEDQKTADERIPILLKTPAAKLWLSVEPMLGHIDTYRSHDLSTSCNVVEWIVCGGESGKNARPMHPEWARSLRDQCQRSGTPFFFKQWGEWAPRAGERCGGGTDFSLIDPSCKKWPKTIRLGEHGKNTRLLENCGDDVGNEIYMQMVGKKLSGRILDGREWNEYPQTMQF